MLYVAFGVGVLLGVFLGILVAGLCRMASERNRSSVGDPYFSDGLSPQVGGMDSAGDRLFR